MDYFRDLFSIFLESGPPQLRFIRTIHCWSMLQILWINLQPSIIMECFSIQLLGWTVPREFPNGQNLSHLLESIHMLTKM